ncbi:hypothetical protein CU669_18325 [Paramagnetospirillum kuznetsovii]|uniref:Uncharacterized protein n=1 Tax=Paramagnetospirillum kuznetsovii TaxID=2053833 RepID=A0A364NTS3_9PROT|nr:hypothetical protein [Paramagnetospirillum kuznetsovii]RAU20499.1 hypothetical protein CU669_18325 [Paramagnetospirillum kuznetsovii]
MGSFRPLRFGFALDGSPASHDHAEMRVTYLGYFNRKHAEADARRRFEEWRRMGNPVARLRSADQVVLG